MAAINVQIQCCDSVDPRWAEGRSKLWPDESAAQHLEDLRGLLRDHTLIGFLALERARLVGFAEASLRRDFVNGCETRPVAFLEGIWVAEEFRRIGVGRMLVSTVEDWARSHGCTELGSDALLDNSASHAAHAGWGFEEMERVVCFRKRIEVDAENLLKAP